MTDATAGRGGVGIRLFVEGASVVRRTFDQVADSGKKMWGEIAMGERAANPAVRALSAGVGEARQGIEGLASRAGMAGTALAAFGFAGVALAAVLGTVAIAATSAFAAMGDAAALTDAADRIGVAVERLQEWRYVADEAGIDTAKLEGGLERLNGVLGRFKLGVGDGKLKPVFEELGITKEQLDNIQTSDQLLSLLADTLGQVEDRAKQVALARALGIEELLPALRLGSQGLADLRDEAHELGLVLNAETVSALDEADRKMELAGQQFKVMKDTALAPLAEMFGNLAQSIAESSVELSNMTGKIPGWQRALLALTGQSRHHGIVGALSKGQAQSEGPFALEAFEGFDVTAADIARVMGLSKGGFETQGHTTGGGSGGSAASQAKRELEQFRAREQRAADRMARAGDEVERAQDRQSNMSIETRFSVEVADLERERAARLREIARDEEEYKTSNGLRGLTEVEAEQLRLKQSELHEIKVATAEWEKRRAFEVKRLRDEEDASRSAIEMLQIEGQLATTSRERARIEREILLSTQAIARKRKAAELENDAELSSEERSRRMGIFDRNAGRQIQLFDETEHRRMVEQFKGYGREVAEAIKQGKLGEYIGERIQEKLLDGALEQLFNIFQNFGKGGGGGGFLSSSLGQIFGSGGASAAGAAAASQGGSGFMGAIASGLGAIFGGGRMGGGGTNAGRFYQTAENGKPELFMLGGQGHVTSAAETVRMLQDSLAGQGSGVASAVSSPSYHFDFKGAVVTQDLIDHANQTAQSAAQSAFNGARDVVPSDRARQDRYTRGRR